VRPVSTPPAGVSELSVPPNIEDNDSSLQRPICRGNVKGELELAEPTTLEKETEQRVKLYYDLYVPGDAHGNMPLLICLHGYEGNKESMMAKARSINSKDFIIASVQAPNSFLIRDNQDAKRPKIGFGWMMQYKAEDTIRLHHETLSSTIQAARAEYDVDDRRIFLLAFSQSVSLNYRFAFTNPGAIRGVIGVCGGIPGDWDQDKYHTSRTDVLIIAGQEDEFYPLERVKTFKEALARRARDVDFYTFPVGHSFPNDALPLINGWLLSRIEQE
jgi:predicted esterase